MFDEKERIYINWIYFGSSYIINSSFSFNTTSYKYYKESKKCIDEYGKSIELAIVSYLLDNGDFPEDVSELSIEYTGNKVVCSTVNLNSDSTVYLSGCSVGGVNVDGYSYGKKEKKSASSSYKIGDVVIYNNVNYYVLKDSDISEQIVTLLKAEPLSVDEVNQYGGGHLNRYTDYSVESAYNLNNCWLSEPQGDSFCNK